jgi:hypothetical protein
MQSGVWVTNACAEEGPEMANAKEVMEWAKNPDVPGLYERAKGEAARRGHPKQTAFAGAGGLLGGVLGSFRGPLGAAVGALLGALLGAFLGMHRDRDGSRVALPKRGPRRPLPVTRGTRHVVRPVQAEPVDAVYRD